MQTAAKQTKINLSEIEPNDVFSEESHYVYLGENSGKYQFRHLESGQTVNLDAKYVSELLVSCDQYEKEVKVGREDKYWSEKQITEAKAKGDLKSDSKVREGDVKVKGIRSIWASIHSAKVFTVNFDKQAKVLSNKALNDAKNKQLQDAVAKIEAAAKGKKGVANTAQEVIKEMQENPILPITKGEERTLRGYKLQFDSINGYYEVLDMDINEQRKVNVNEINWLVVDNVKYVVE